jgi:hypothetical protein
MEELLEQWDATSAAREYLRSVEGSQEGAMDSAQDFACFVVTDKWNTELPQAIVDDFVADVVQKVEERAVDEVYKATQEQISKLRMNAFHWYNWPDEKLRRQQAIDAEVSRVRSIHEEARRDATKHLNQKVINDNDFWPRPSSTGTVIELCSPKVVINHNPSSTILIKPGRAFRQAQQSAREGSMDSVLKEKQ